MSRGLGDVYKRQEFYMGKNSNERQGFIIGNLRVEADYVEDLI